MISACVPDYFCDADDVLLLEEIGREVTGKTSETPCPSLELSVRLVETKGVFWNRLTKENPERFSLDGIRLVVAILKDSQVVTASSPSDPLVCPSAEHNKNAVAFEARWSNGGGILSFDHPSDDSSPIDLVIALVNGNETKEDFLLACPCGDTLLSLSQKIRNGDRRELTIKGLPSPRNYVLFPSFNGKDQVETSRSQSTYTSNFGNQAEIEEKKWSEPGREIELPYLSLEKASLCVEVSWKQKELDVEICYTGRDKMNRPSKKKSQQEFVVDLRCKGYTPVRTHRLQKVESGDTYGGGGVEESPISVLVGALDSPKRQQRVPLVTSNARASDKRSAMSTANGGRVTPALDKCGLEYQEGSELLDQVRRTLARDDEFREESDHSKPFLLKESSLSHSENEGNNRKVGQKSLTISKKGKQMARAALEDALPPKPRRSWGNAFRKPRSQQSRPTSSSSVANSDESVLKELALSLDEENGASKHESAPHNEENLASLQMIPRKRLLSGFGSKTGDRSRDVFKGPGTETESPLLKTASSNEKLRIGGSRMDDISVLSVPQGLQAPSPVKRADEDMSGGIRLLTSFCSNGDEVLTTLNDQAWSASEVSPQLESLPQRDASQLSKEDTGVTWVSHESIEPVQRDQKSFAAMLEDVLLSPPAFCSTLSDVTMDYTLEQQLSLEERQSIGRYRSLEDFEDSISKKSNKSDEITIMSKIEDRLLMRTYHAMGGKHLDHVTDVILRNSPGMIQQWLDRDSEGDQSVRAADESVVYREEDVLSLADVDFERATTAASKALSRQLTTITEEETESRGLHTKSGSTEISCPSTSEDQGHEVEVEGGVSPCTDEELVRSASF